MTMTRALLPAALFAATLMACAPITAAGPAPARGVPGFDTRDYPGDAALTTWFDASPYRWVGYYLPAPCYTGTTWSGRRDALRAMGWGFAVLFVGEQDWTAMRSVPGDTVDIAEQGARCVSANLTAEQGSAHAREAEAATAADGFPDGTIIFLDVERVERVTPELADYVRSWIRSLLELRRFLPGLYAHALNVPDLYVILEEEYARHGRTGRPPLWVAQQDGFDIVRGPAESGWPASVWQGRFDTPETWNDVTLNIDVNVADSADPSRGR